MAQWQSTCRKSHARFSPCHLHFKMQDHSPRNPQELLLVWTTLIKMGLQPDSVSDVDAAAQDSKVSATYPTLFTSQNNFPLHLRVLNKTVKGEASPFHIM